MRHAGLTLVETVVTAALTAIIFAVLGTTLLSFYRTNAYLFQQAQATLEARRGLSDTLRYVREASYGGDGSYPVSTAATSTLALTVDANHDGTTDAITYTLVGTELQRTVTIGGEDTTITISSMVRNSTTTPIFRYLDTAGADLSTPVDRSKISSIIMTLVVVPDINRSAQTLTLTGQATLRNSRL